MSSISSISGYSDYSAYSKISSGGTINKASDGATELAMQEKTKTQVNGLDAGSENLQSAKSVLNIEDGALDQVTDYLQSIKELSVKAMNGTTSDSDREAIQGQISQYLQGIEDVAANTTYNGKNLLDGSSGDLSVATNGTGSTMDISTANSTLEALGIKDFDVTGDFDISDIDNALETVTSSRTSAGAQSNAVDYALNYNSHAAMELNGYQMDREQSNVMDALQELKSKQALDTYQTQIQKKEMENNQQQAMSVFV